MVANLKNASNNAIFRQPLLNRNPSFFMMQKTGILFYFWVDVIQIDLIQNYIELYLFGRETTSIDKITSFHKQVVTYDKGKSDFLLLVCSNSYNSNSIIVIFSSSKRPLQN